MSAWQALGADVSLISEDSVAEKLGTDYYAGAWLDPRGGSLNPLAYVRGLAVAACNTGVRIHERTPRDYYRRMRCRVVRTDARRECRGKDRVVLHQCLQSRS